MTERSDKIPEPGFCGFLGAGQTISMGQYRVSCPAPALPLRWVLTGSMSHWSQPRIFQYLPTCIKLVIPPQHGLHSYAAVNARISGACDTIHDGFYSNCILTATAYEILIWD